MPVRTASARWDGTLREGSGSVSFGEGEYQGRYSFGSRFEEGTGTNPEELLGAAHAACFSMALAAGLGRAGFEPQRVETDARVILENLQGSWTVVRIELSTEAEVPGIAAAAFQEAAEGAKRNCPISRALGEVEISLTARLVGS